jgi:hypothetical protein
LTNVVCKYTKLFLLLLLLLHLLVVPVLHNDREEGERRRSLFYFLFLSANETLSLSIISFERITFYLLLPLLRPFFLSFSLSFALFPFPPALNTFPITLFPSSSLFS